VGGRKVSELLGGDKRISFKQIDYGRSDRLLERLFTWAELVGAVGELTAGLESHEYLVVDPDTRLTQSGLLPVAESYLFFPSREYGYRTGRSLGELASDWLNEVFGGQESIFPRLYLKSANLERAAALVARMRQNGRAAVVAINFGVGENRLKRVGDDFEKHVVSGIIEQGAGVILDKGAGEDEARRAEAAVSHAIEQSRDRRLIRALEINEENLAGLLTAEAQRAELLVWSGSIGFLAALISESDLYIGYDSAGQHIAAAAGVGCVDVFAGYSSRRMLERWRPTGPGQSRVIAVETAHASAADAGSILSDLMRHVREMLKGAR
jgi:ADP-heptose:LPS heptosyltransferase